MYWIGICDSGFVILFQIWIAFTDSSAFRLKNVHARREIAPALPFTTASAATDNILPLRKGNSQIKKS